MEGDFAKPISFARKSSVGLILLSLYMIGLIWILFSVHTSSFSRSSTHFQEVTPQLIPFKSIFQYVTAIQLENKVSASLSNVLGNIVLFVPWGFLIAQTFIFLRNWLLVSLSSLALSLLAEVIQFTFKVGVFDVDDIILNTLGGIVGYTIWKKTMKKRF